MAVDTHICEKGHEISAPDKVKITKCTYVVDGQPCPAPIVKKVKGRNILEYIRVVPRRKDK